MFWWIVLGVVVVGFALAWWSSGRAHGGVDPSAVDRQRKIDEGRGTDFSSGT
jgi:hypothetical protein